MADENTQSADQSEEDQQAVAQRISAFAAAMSDNLVQRCVTENIPPLEVLSGMGIAMFNVALSCTGGEKEKADNLMTDVLADVMRSIRDASSRVEQSGVAVGELQTESGLVVVANDGLIH